MIDIFEYIENAPANIDWNAIIIHHSATPDGAVKDWDAIRQWHKGLTGTDNPSDPNFNPYKIRPMVDIGYHLGLEFIDKILTYQIGRSLDLRGAHTLGMNSVAIGICLVGDYDVKEPIHQQYFMLAMLCKALMDKYHIIPSNIYPHRTFAKKTCPGLMFDMDKLKGLL